MPLEGEPEERDARAAFGAVAREEDDAGRFQRGGGVAEP